VYNRAGEPADCIGNGVTTGNRAEQPSPSWPNPLHAERLLKESGSLVNVRDGNCDVPQSRNH
jgi:hypothetical protein